ncbi:GTP 3',8-cyclase MoaA [Brevundimonas sp.]|uniref:GTP 3',8-cyclase MoaA n=1 Tax=Brevundimonas sp. TaxID=1871086 RepID=UPI00289A50F5|nr:GTP 3',8-cyclase MoaA [Brevundimonas sp.]
MTVVISADKARSRRICTSAPLIDPFGRRIDYVRVSVTDRCDLRCTYCMLERQTFLPRADLLSFAELDRLCSAFVDLGATRLRLTGGEPLVRKGFMDFVAGLSRHLVSGRLRELTLTTNGTRLARHAEGLAAAGIRRINVSLDTLDPDRYRRITRGGDLGGVLEGLKAARDAGLRVKINAVALRHDNADELADMVAWAHSEAMDITLIETMPLGMVEEDRMDQYLPMSEVRATLARRWTLASLDVRTGGPARYVEVRETGGRLGFITPLTHGFCEGCNRVRVTCTGQLYLCLGQEDGADLQAALRGSDDDGALTRSIREAISRKPRGHDFEISRRGAAPAVPRPMSMTGG